MPVMPNNLIKDYFSFTKKERIGVIVLVLVIIIVFLIPYLLPQRKENINLADWEQFKVQSDKLRKPEKDSKTFTEPNEESSPSYDSQKDLSAFAKHEPIKSGLFYFDPNTLSEQGWEKLGLRRRTISTIQNYLSKGGRFTHSADLGKIYGLHKNELERLMPYVKINNIFTLGVKRANSQNFQQSSSYRSASSKYSSTSISVLDINTADTTQLIALPGIGSKLAGRIIHFREKLGAFYSVDQLSDVYGLPDSTFQKLRSRLTVSSKSLKIININTADVNELKELPYIKWNLANAIIEFRNRHGKFTNLEELLQIEICTQLMFKKMSPYLSIQ